MPWPEAITLRSERVTLEPLAQRHHDDLVEAVKDGELWRLWYTTIPAPERMGAEIERRLGLQASGSMLPFAVIDGATAKAVGMTTYMNIDAANRRVEIGSTWYRRSVQRTDLNTHCKLLLLAHAFETLTASPWSSAPISSTTRAGTASSGWAPSSTASCAATSWPATARCAIPASTASSPASGRR